MPKALWVLLNLRSTPFGKCSLSFYEIVIGCPTHEDEGAYKPTLLKGDILHHCPGLINQLKEIDKLVTGLFYSVLLGDKAQKPYSV